MTHNYLDSIVYRKQGSKHIYPASEANVADKTLIPITVREAIDMGYIKDPKSSTQSGKSNDTLKEEFQSEIRELKNLIKDQQQLVSELKRELDDKNLKIHQLEMSTNQSPVGVESHPVVDNTPVETTDQVQVQEQLDILFEPLKEISN